MTSGMLSFSLFSFLSFAMVSIRGSKGGLLGLNLTWDLLHGHWRGMGLRGSVFWVDGGMHRLRDGCCHRPELGFQARTGSRMGCNSFPSGLENDVFVTRVDGRCRNGADILLGTRIIWLIFFVLEHVSFLGRFRT